MLDNESLQAIREIMKEELRFQDERYDIKLTSLKNDIYSNMSELHMEIIEDIGKLDEKISNNNKTLEQHAISIKRHDIEIKALKQKAG